ncbi:MAG: hypothetical protein KGH71_04585 [Candidatus Micrarchaeota archaeon]|nr:hypothetical protein [Candidatus Micrarchaeota archaeon]
MSYVTLKRVEPMSLAKIEAVLGAIIGFIVGILLWGVLGVAGNFYPMVAAVSSLGVFLPILGIILGAVIGFIANYIQAFVYNWLAKVIGGLKINLNAAAGKMSSLDTVGVQSAGKILAGLLLIMAAIIAVVVLVVLAAIGLPISAGTLVLVLIVGGIAVLVFGFVIGLVYSAIYNLVAHKIGGIKIMLSGKGTSVLQRIEPMQYAKVLAVLEAVFSFISGIFALFVGGSIIGHLIIAPIAQAVFGFIFGYIFALLYNYIARKIGGVKVTLA